MPKVFVSYSHRDSSYAHRLADELRRHAIDVWIDERIDYGDQWPRVIQENLNACRAFLLIMSTNAFNSMWVQNEVSYAQGKDKLIYPLLLEGQVWLSMAAMQYVDVRDGGMPPDRFFEELHTDLMNQPAPPARERLEPAPRKQPPPKKSRRALYIAGAVLLCAAMVCAVAPAAWRRLSPLFTAKPPVQVKVTDVPMQPSLVPEPEFPVMEPSPTYSIAEKYGLPYGDMEVPGMWFEAGLCYDLDVMSPAEDPACDAYLDYDGQLYPVNLAQASGYIVDRSLDLTICGALMNEKQDVLAPVPVLDNPIVCFLTDQGGYGFLIVLNFDLPRGITFDAYVIH